MYEEPISHSKGYDCKNIESRINSTVIILILYVNYINFIFYPTKVAVSLSKFQKLFLLALNYFIFISAHKRILMF